MFADKSEIQGSLISYFSNLVKIHGGINLAQGIPGFNPPERLLEILSEIRDENIHQYAPGKGNADLLNQLYDLYRNKFDEKRSEFFIVNGATEAISLVYTYLHKKYKSKLNVLTISPAYESYIHLPRIFENKLYYQELNNDEEFNIDELEKNIKSNKIKLLFIASPGNPWGKVINISTLNKICELCSKYKCYVIIDAVYSKLYFDKTPPEYPLNKINEYVFYVNSFSKMFSITGWRVGYFLADKKHIDGLASIHDYIGLSTPAPFQQAIANFLKETTYQQEYVNDLRDKISTNFYKSKVELEKMGFTVPGHDGGFFVWAKLPDNMSDSLDFGVELYNKTKTAIIPGVHFGSSWNKYIRINIALPENNLFEGIQNIHKYIKQK